MFQKISLSIYIVLLVSTVILLFYNKIKKQNYLDFIDSIYILCCVGFELLGRLLIYFKIKPPTSLYDLIVPSVILIALELVFGNILSKIIFILILTFSSLKGFYVFEIVCYALCIIMLIYRGVLTYFKYERVISLMSTFVMAFVFLLSLFNLMMSHRQLFLKDSQYLSYYLVVFSSALVLNLLLINAKSSRYFTV